MAINVNKKLTQDTRMYDKATGNHFFRHCYSRSVASFPRALSVQEFFKSDWIQLQSKKHCFWSKFEVEPMNGT